jgi:hypothetical protein
MPNLLNFVLFQLNWAACIYSASVNGNVIALVSTLMFVAVHLSFYSWRRSDIKLMMLGLSIGLLLDTLWSLSGVMFYQAHSFAPLAPVWILCLWVNFMLTINHSLLWLNDKIWLASLLAAAGGPLSYFAGLKFGAVTWGETSHVITVIAVSWALMMLIVLKASQFWRQQEQEQQHAVA